MSPKLAVEDIRKTFFKAEKNDLVGIPVLDGVSLSVSQGEFVSVIGPSGCGKSTLLRIIDGLIQPDQGRVLVFKVNTTGTLQLTWNSANTGAQATVQAGLTINATTINAYYLGGATNVQVGTLTSGVDYMVAIAPEPTAGSCAVTKPRAAILALMSSPSPTVISAIIRETS